MLLAVVDSDASVFWWLPILLIFFAFIVLIRAFR